MRFFSLGDSEYELDVKQVVRNKANMSNYINISQSKYKRDYYI